MTRVLVDKGMCIGCDMCAEECPETFRMERRKAVVRNHRGNSKEELEDVAGKCPTHAIHVSETDWLENIEFKS